MIKPVLSISQPLSLSQSVEIAVKKGPISVTPVSYTASTWNASNTKIKIEPNDLVSPLDPNILIQVIFDATVNGTGGASGNFLDFGTYSALRSFPLDRAINNTNISKNGAAGTQFLNSDAIVEMERYAEDKLFLESSCGMTPTKPDIFASYATPYTGNSNQIGIARDPLTSYGNSEGNISRGAFNDFIKIISGNNSPGVGVATTVVLRITLEGSIQHPNLKAYKSNAKYMVGLRTLDINIQFNNNLFPLIFSQSDAPDAGKITGSSVAITIPPRFSTMAYKLPMDFAIPEIVYSSYPKQEILPQNAGVVAAGATKTIFVNNYKLGTDLNYISVYARRSTATWKADCTSTNTFATPVSISIKYDGSSSILNDATDTQLWQIANSNGCLINYIEAMGDGKCGFPLRLYFTKQIPLITGAPGMPCNKQISLTFTFKNQTTENINYDVFVVYGYNGVEATVVDQANTTYIDNILNETDFQSVGNVITDETDVTPSNPKDMWGGKKFVPYNQMVGGSSGSNKKGLFAAKMDLQRRY